MKRDDFNDADIIDNAHEHRRSSRRCHADVADIRLDHFRGAKAYALSCAADICDICRGNSRLGANAASCDAVVVPSLTRS